MVTTAEPTSVVGPADDVDPYATVVGQLAARHALATYAVDPVNAYLIVGPPGSGKLDLALAFAADVISQGMSVDDRRRVIHLTRANNHADVIVLTAEGVNIRKGEAGVLTAEAHRSPIEGQTKVIIGVGYDAITEIDRITEAA
jgi:DNA polymerase-3 subunit delta'